ncbi:DUF2961 domain-containing protein [Parapedobacter pyrenivorans]|uniref:DUF2961 domain-containing protein n=1 Tax=Parapedobacter pyrenivorans TaxID=1305674 RepID=UPI00333F9782
MKNRFLYLFVFLGLNCPISRLTAQQPPTIPVGLDAYRMWDKLPLQRIGERAYMISTYMREGGNRAADSRNFLWMGKSEDFNVTMDVVGPGVLYFKRTNHWHGSPWHYVVDDHDYVIKETGTDDPENAKKEITHATFLPEKAFPEPLTFTWTKTKGADLMWVPIGFQKSLQLAYSRTFYGTGYYIYKRYANEKYLSQPIKAWDVNDVPDRDVVDLLSRSGSDIAPKDIPAKQGTIALDNSRKVFAEIRDAGPSVVRALKFTIPLEKAIDLEDLQLLVTWDDRINPSINAPLALFYGTGTLYNREQQEFLVKGFPINIRFDYDSQQVELSCYYPMPFFKSARFEIAGIDPGDTEIQYEIRYEPYKDVAPNQSSYFHATYKDFADPELGLDMTLLDTRGVEGEDVWSGNFVGTSFLFTKRNFLQTLEADPRFFFDGARTPQAHGTGTEEWGGGGDYWGGETMTLPFAGHPVGARRGDEAKNEKDSYHSAYRFLIADAMPFGNRAVINLEHGGWNLSKEHYRTVTYWYGLPSASLIQTDELNVGNEQSEKYHAYHSPHASEVEEITSRYDGLSIDTFPQEAWELPKDERDHYDRYIGSEVFAPHTETGRYTRGESEFSVHLDSKNYGAMLRRAFDYSFPNQKAEVYIADASGSFDPENPKWEYAGIWYTAGSNSYMYSPPKGELGERVYEVMTSNRKFRDDEFLIPARLTQGRSAIRVRVKFVPEDRELYPGYPYPKKSAWSELRYEVYSYVMPNFVVK